MCNEVSDRANNDHLRVVIRYVLDSGDVREILIATVRVDNTTAINLSLML